MTQYLALYFSAASDSDPSLLKYLGKQGVKVSQGEALFSYLEGGQEKHFHSPLDGTLKVFLENEGHPLAAGKEVVVLEVAAALASEYEKQGLGKILHPEELKQLAEAASIRLPPE